MAFDTQTVTIKGAELLAAATAANQLIIDGCDATTGYMTQAQAVNVSTRPASPVSNTTDVTQLGSTAEHINSRVYFRTGVNAGGDVNTLFLYGHSASAPNDKFVIFVASAQTSFHLPVAGDVIDEWECALDIVYTINPGAVGFATQATYCSLSEFNLLKERTVTTHKEGLPTTGEDQTIYGDKLFKDKILIAGSGIPADEECAIQEMRYPGEEPGEYETWIRFEWPDGEDSHTLYIGGSCQIDENLDILGAITSDSLRLVHDLTVEGDVSVGQSVVVTGGCNFKDVVVLEGDLYMYNEMTTNNAIVLSSNSAEGVSDSEIVDIYGVRNVYMAGSVFAGETSVIKIESASLRVTTDIYGITIKNVTLNKVIASATNTGLYAADNATGDAVFSAGGNLTPWTTLYADLKFMYGSTSINATTHFGSNSYGYDLTTTFSQTTGDNNFEIVNGSFKCDKNVILTAGDIIFGTSTNTCVVDYSAITNGYQLDISLPSASSSVNKVTVTNASLFSKNVISENGVMRVLDSSNNIRVSLAYNAIEAFDTNNQLSAVIYSATGGARFGGDLEVGGEANCQNDLAVAGDLSVSGSASLGATGVTGLSGISPQTPDSGTEIKLPVGGIVLIYQTNTWSVGSVQTFTAGSVYVAEFLNDGSTGWKASSYTIPAGKYVVLMSYIYSGSGGLKAPTLVQRVKD